MISVATSRRLKLRHILLYGFTGFIMAYFAYHALSGSKGVWALYRISGDISEAQSRLDVVRAERMALEARVAGMYEKTLDLDLLDEQARSTLGLAGKDEIVMYLDHAKN